MTVSHHTQLPLVLGQVAKAVPPCHRSGVNVWEGKTEKLQRHVSAQQATEHGGQQWMPERVNFIRLHMHSMSTAAVVGL